MTTLEKSMNMGSSIVNVTPIKPSEIDNGVRQRIATGGKLSPAQGLRDAEKKELDQAVSNVSSYVQSISRELNFSVDKELDRFVVRVIDEATGDLIRQIPTEEILELAKSISYSQGEGGKEVGARGILFQGDA